MRKFVFVILALVVLAIGAWLALDFAIARAIEKGGTYALAVDTQVGGVQSSLIGGELGIDELEIANPAGFESPFFLHVRRTAVAVSPASLTKDVIEVPRFELTGLELNLERGKDGTNYGALLDALKRFESNEPAKREDASGTKFMIREVLLKDLRVHADVGPQMLGKVSEFSVTIPELRLENVGTAEGGQSISQLIGHLIKVVLAASIEAGVELPVELLNDLRGSLEKLGGKEVESLLKGVAGGIEQVGEGAGKVLEGVGKELDKIFK